MKKRWIYRSKKMMAMPELIEKERVQIFFDSYNTTTLSARIKPFKNEEGLMQYTGYHGKWRRYFFYVGLTVGDTRENTIHTSYLEPRIRLEYCGSDLFLCAYLRHNGEWHDITYGNPMSLDTCFVKADSFLLIF